MKRRAISKEIRFQILKRDNSKCSVCGRGAEDGVKLTVDHKTPLSKGGTDELENLWTLCYECNQGKADRIFKVASGETKTGTVGIPIPPEYAFDQVVQILGEYLKSSKVSSLSIQQVIAVVHRTPPLSFNPLYYPLPDQAILTALGSLEKERKVRIKDGIVDFTNLSDIHAKEDQSIVTVERKRELIKEIYNPLHGSLTDALVLLERNHFGKGERNNTLGDRVVRRVQGLKRNIFWHQIDPDLQSHLEGLEDIFEKLRKTEEDLAKELPRIWQFQQIDPSETDKFLELSLYTLLDYKELPREVINRMEDMIRTSKFPYGKGPIIGMFFKQVWEEFKVDLGKKENYKAYCNERKVWEETLSQAREIVIEQIK